MVSDAYREIENRTAQALFMQNELVGELMNKTGQGQLVIERALYFTSVTCGMRSTEIALVVNEFLVHLREMTEPVQEPEQESPFIGR